MLRKLLQAGPVCVSMLVPDDSTFNSYSEGVHDYEEGEIPAYRGYAVLVGGYNDIEQSVKV